MSANFQFLRTVSPIGLEELYNLHTRTLLKRLKDLNSLHESFDSSDWREDERDAVAAAGLIAFKDTAIWKQAYSELKSVLDSREHIDRGGREARRRAQKAKQTR